jgi:hypothetical protein
MFKSSLLTQVNVLTAILATEERILPVGRHKELVVSKLLNSSLYIQGADDKLGQTPRPHLKQ